VDAVVERHQQLHRQQVDHARAHEAQRGQNGDADRPETRRSHFFETDDLKDAEMRFANAYSSHVEGRLDDHLKSFRLPDSIKGELYCDPGSCDLARAHADFTVTPSMLRSDNPQFKLSTAQSRDMTAKLRALFNPAGAPQSDPLSSASSFLQMLAETQAVQHAAAAARANTDPSPSSGSADQFPAEPAADAATGTVDGGDLSFDSDVLPVSDDDGGAQDSASSNTNPDLGSTRSTISTGDARVRAKDEADEDSAQLEGDLSSTPISTDPVLEARVESSAAAVPPRANTAPSAAAPPPARATAPHPGAAAGPAGSDLAVKKETIHDIAMRFRSMRAEAELARSELARRNNINLEADLRSQADAANSATGGAEAADAAPIWIKNMRKASYEATVHLYTQIVATESHNALTASVGPKLFEIFAEPMKDFVNNSLSHALLHAVSNSVSWLALKQFKSVHISKY